MGDQLSWFVQKWGVSAQKWGVSWDLGFSVLKSEQSDRLITTVHQNLYGSMGPQSSQEVFIPQTANLDHSKRHNQFLWSL